MKKMLLSSLIAVSVLALPAVTFAVSFEPVGETLGLGTADLKETVINVINWVLGLLGIIAVIMILVGGFQWMTAAGNEEKVEKAKKVISAAIVGLIIILLAWAIVNFVIGTTSNVSGA